MRSQRERMASNQVAVAVLEHSLLFFSLKETLLRISLSERLVPCCVIYLVSGIISVYVSRKGRRVFPPDRTLHTVAQAQLTGRQLSSRLAARIVSAGASK